MKKTLWNSSLACAVVCLFGALAEGGNWPQFRGPNGSGISAETGIPLEWSADRNLRWKIPIPGQGHSSPVVWGDRVFVTSAVRGEKLEASTAVRHLINGEEFEHPQWAGSDYAWTLRVLCLDRESGRILWDRTAFQGTVYDHIHEMGSYAASTPVTDGARVWAYFGAEGLYCYDFAGDLRWKASLGGIGTAGMGTGTSPVLYQDRLLIVVDQEFDGQDSYLVALDRESGKELWRVSRQARVTWATPLLVGTERRTELIVSGAEAVVSYDPKTGSEYWRGPGLLSHAIPSPVSDGEIVYLSAGSQAKRSMAVRLGGAGDLSESGLILWRYDKGAAYVPSPIYYQGHFYLLSDQGVITCLEARSGEVAYQERLPASSAFRASPVALQGRLLFSSEDGSTFVIKAGPVFEVEATNEIGEGLWASPAISEGMIFLRGKAHLFAIAAR